MRSVRQFTKRGVSALFAEPRCLKSHRAKKRDVTRPKARDCLGLDEKRRAVSSALMVVFDPQMGHVEERPEHLPDQSGQECSVGRTHRQREVLGVEWANLSLVDG